MITSESRSGEAFSDVHPFFKGICDMKLQPASSLDQVELDLVFLALPHGVSMKYVERFLKRNIPVVDLSGDFRLANKAVYESWYKKDHSYAEGFDKAAYGLPELFRDQIKSKPIIANPGCYPTSVLLGLAPVVHAGIADTQRIIADSKSGITGAGVKAKEVNRYSNVNEDFKAYALKSHRHTIEIQEKTAMIGDGEVNVQFTPHLLPLDRGILSTIYLRPTKDVSDDILRSVYSEFYREAPFVRLVDQPPAVKNVRGTNYCDIMPLYDDRTGNIIILSAIDNLVKGAAGQAIQNMNVIFGFEEHAGLLQVPLNP